MEDKPREEASGEGEEERENLINRFPDVPPGPEVPEPPNIKSKLPPHPAKPEPGSFQPGSYNKMAIAATAASSFIMPIIVLSVLGWWLDQKLHHTTNWMAMIGVLLGLVAGISGLLNVLKRLE